MFSTFMSTILFIHFQIVDLVICSVSIRRDNVWLNYAFAVGYRFIVASGSGSVAFGSSRAFRLVVPCGDQLAMEFPDVLNHRLLPYVFAIVFLIS